MTTQAAFSSFKFSSKLRLRILAFFFSRFAVMFAAMAVMSVASFAQAEHLSADAREWAKVIRKGANMQFGAIDLATNVLPPAVKNKIGVIAEDQAQGWADTILEGDFLADETVHIEAVESIHLEKDFLGYRVTYSSPAYDISNCDATKNIASCQPGRIVEASMISPALNSWLRDRNAFAEFVPSP